MSGISKYFKKMKDISLGKAWLVVVLTVVSLGIITVGSIAYAKSYEGRVLPGVQIGSSSIGGMTATELSTYLHMVNDKLVNAGIHIRFDTEDGEKTIVLSPTVVGNDNVIELIYVDIEKEVEDFVSRGKDANVFARAWSTLLSRVMGSEQALGHVSLDRDSLFDQLAGSLAPYESQPKNASVHINSISPISYEVTSSSAGVVFDYENIVDEITSAWAVLSIPDIFIERRAVESEIFEEEVQGVIGRLPEIIEHGGIDLTYTDPHTKRPYTWKISTVDITSWIEAQKDKDGKVVFGLSPSSTKLFLEEDIAKIVNVEAESAKFEVVGDRKVEEFKGSRPGIGLDVDETYKILNDAVVQRTWHDEGIVNSVAIVVAQVEPEVKTGEVNDLGINEILGVGYSNFSGSPPNRVKNIRHAVYNKLNGLLIKPDEDFSLINALKPFTIEGGYLPELVIKGDKIEPEIGGGLCQIGSTMFRTAMNSGLPITQRRNHSLVVSYYNDHRNGNPGTDATIYDPAPDFRFKNDTGNYILLTTEMNTQNGDIYFTLWGTSDGRKGSYSEPVVSKWIPYGPVKEIESTELAPGQRKCQGAHTGAVASFTYTRELSNGEKIDRVFESYYRPLPTTCLVGVEEKGNAGEERVCEILPSGQESCTTPDTPEEIGE